MKRNLYKIMKKDSMFAPLNEEQKKSVIKKCDELMDLGIMHKDLPDHFECVSIDMIKNLGIKSKRDTVLTPVQRKFCYEFVKNSNPSKAMERLRCDESLKDAYGIESNGYYFLDLPKVKEKIRQLVENADVDSERIINEQSKVAFFNPKKMFNDDGSPKSITEIDDQTAGAIAGIDVFEEYAGKGEERELVGYVKKYKIADKNKALENLAKILGIFREKVDHEHSGGVTVNSKLDFSNLTEDQLKAIASVKINGE